MLKHLYQLRYVLGVSGLALLAALLIILPPLQSFLEGNYFRAWVESRIGESLELKVQIQGIHWAGLSGFEVDSIAGSNGVTALDEFSLPHLTGHIHPLSPFVQLWELDDVEAEHGTLIVKLPNTDYYIPNPNPIANWYFPDQIRLQHLLVTHGDIINKISDQTWGIYNTRFVVNHFGEGYEYDAQSGVLRLPIGPEMHLIHLNFLVKDSNLLIPELTFNEDPDTAEANIRISASLGLTQDQIAAVQADWKMIDINKWLSTLPFNITGFASGHLQGRISNLRWKELQLTGNVDISNGTFSDLPNQPPITFDQVQANIVLKNSILKLTNIIINSEGNVHVTGYATIDFLHNVTLDGQVLCELNKNLLNGLTKPTLSIADGVTVSTPVVIGGTWQHPTITSEPEPK